MEKLPGHPLFFQYVPNIPFKLGLVQLALAVTGIVLARRRDPEWIYLIVATVLAGLSSAPGAAALARSRILVSVEFTLRQLTIMSLPLALFTGAIVLPLRRPGYQLALGAAVAFCHRGQSTSASEPDPADVGGS